MPEAQMTAVSGIGKLPKNVELWTTVGLLQIQTAVCSSYGSCNEKRYSRFCTPDLRKKFTSGIRLRSARVYLDIV